ncbi:MAG: hypothetical protein ACRDQ7_11385 [Haloechinothrix sp.]
MPPPVGPFPAAGVLAHPVTQPDTLPISPLVAGCAAFAFVLLVALGCPRASHRKPRQSAPPVESWAGELSVPKRLMRMVAVAVLVLAIAAGRLGIDNELENLAPALVVGALWPLLVLASVSLGPVWRWTDPWDGMARAITPGQQDAGPGHVWPAALIAVPWMWYLSAYLDPLDPRSVGAVLAGYTVVTVGGCLATGRTRWLATSEPFGIVLGWLALLPRGRLADWKPPRGAEVLLGVLAGGVLFGAVRRSEFWGGLNTVDGAAVFAVLGVVGSCAAAAGLLWWMGIRAEPRRARPAVARAAVPAVAAIIVAVAMDSHRLFTSVQLLPALLGDPFGLGWGLLGPAGAGLNPAPLGTSGLLAAQLAVLLVGHLAGAVVLARRVRWAAREPAVVALSTLAAASVIALVTP